MGSAYPFRVRAIAKSNFRVALQAAIRTFGNYFWQLVYSKLPDEVGATVLLLILLDLTKALTSKELLTHLPVAGAEIQTEGKLRRSGGPLNFVIMLMDSGAMNLHILRIPKGFRPPAQGCEERATLGLRRRRITTLKGLRQISEAHRMGRGSGEGP